MSKCSRYWKQRCNSITGPQHLGDYSAARRGESIAIFGSVFMEESEIDGLACGSPVWIWMVRSGEGQWWPGIVQSIGVVDGASSISVKFEYQSPRRAKSRLTTFIGISTTQTRYLERRQMDGKGIDRPLYVPSLLRATDEPTPSE